MACRRHVRIPGRARDALSARRLLPVQSRLPLGRLGKKRAGSLPRGSRAPLGRAPAAVRDELLLVALLMRGAAQKHRNARGWSGPGASKRAWIPRGAQPRSIEMRGDSPRRAAPEHRDARGFSVARSPGASRCARIPRGAQYRRTAMRGVTMRGPERPRSRVPSCIATESWRLSLLVRSHGAGCACMPTPSHDGARAATHPLSHAMPPTHRRGDNAHHALARSSRIATVYGHPAFPSFVCICGQARGVHGVGERVFWAQPKNDERKERKDLEAHGTLASWGSLPTNHQRRGSYLAQGVGGRVRKTGHQNFTNVGSCGNPCSVESTLPA